MTKHQPLSAFSADLVEDPSRPTEFNADRNDDRLISLCRAAAKALHHEGRICGSASNLMYQVQRDMPPPKPPHSWISTGTSAADARDEMRKLRAMKDGYNKGTCENYRLHLQSRRIYERELNAEFRRRGGERLQRREAASRRRYESLMSRICTTPAQTALGLSFKCSLIKPWQAAGFDFNDETQLLRSIADDQLAICHGWQNSARKPEPDQSLISLAARVERQLSRNQAAWHALSELQDQLHDFARAKETVPAELRRQLTLADSRAKYADRVSEKHLLELADWPALTGNGYVAKTAAFKSFQRFAVRTKGGDALYASLNRDFDNLQRRQAATRAPEPCAQQVHH